SLESTLDIDMVSAICPTCHILLVEAASNNLDDLGASVNRAASFVGVVAISNSYGTSGEFPSEQSFDSFYTHQGIAVTASSGDDGFGVEFPAASRAVIAVGGTHLEPAANARGWDETAWTGSGSGCSSFEPRPTWLARLPARQPSPIGSCFGRRVADVSAVA